jgi:hypothetical protein
MVSTLGRFTAGIAAAAALIVVAPNASAEPVWPVAGAQSAAATIAELEAQGYDVQINWISGQSSVPLSRCSVKAIHNPDRSPGSEKTFTTVYVDVACPNEHDDDWVWGGIGFGIGF